ncbi:type III-B CRISPR module-associated protein Cmr5 [Clostridium fermenticellae]|uniref:CRISPR type III-B/RAMP module-associated protein Cmr5 n=1 Tax=Clostridium fermenticellae TaxID=2068654 RepID=A0A386H3K7_9CLOT|nr:type III-B CRISPR module-associated protein Cmr5 [Clostridium fermenticellae]AYD40246.1 type III-B CRISPR module-associated protein Cmr5 [Clostridium fermenticellae]
MTCEFKDLGRKKAEFAFIKIEEIYKENNKKFKSYIKQIPMYIYNNGLIATLSFILKKSNKNKESEEGKSYCKICEILNGYLNDEKFNEYCIKPRSNDLKEIIKYLASNECGSGEYRRITLNVLSILEWLIRFSEGIL